MISEEQLQKWTGPGAECDSEEKALRRLRILAKEVRRLREENRVVEQAAAIFLADVESSDCFSMGDSQDNLREVLGWSHKSDPAHGEQR